MKVNLRVVGIQFHKDVTVTKPNPTIRDVMEAARGGPEDFNYITAPDGTLYQASAVLVKDTPSISSGRLFPAGLYELADGVNGDNSITTWQWYLVRGGVQINQPNGLVEPFSTTSPTIQDGDKIIWRLVVVATMPTIAGGSKSYDQKKSRLL
ncbi:MAG: hypothetical protein ACRC8S_05065 [Fimbriiglobus sp.]